MYKKEADFNKHFRWICEYAGRSNLAAEPQPTTADVAKIMKEFDSVSLEEVDSRAALSVGLYVHVVYK